MESNTAPPLISHKDIETVNDELSTGQSLHFENFLTDLYLDEFIDKPWGHEYRVYSDLFVDIWRLQIEPKQLTSMHCHPRKETVLLCLHGNILIRFFNESKMLTKGDFVFIPKGVFHSTENIGETPAHVIEVETPRNKFDLIRKRDKYGRQGQAYETNYSKRNISPLIQVDNISARKIRHFDLDKDYEFSCMVGSNIRSHKHADGAIAVSLALEDIILHKINIVTCVKNTFEGISNEKHYLVIKPYSKVTPIINQ